MTREEKIQQAAKYTKTSQYTERVLTGNKVKCKHLGEDTGEIRQCQSCRGKVSLKVLSCKIHGKCTILRKQPDLICCNECDEYEPVQYYTPNAYPTPILPTWSYREPLRFDHTNLFPDLPGKRFNPGLITNKDGYIFSWRDGWAGSNIWLVRLDKKFQPIGLPIKPDLRHDMANYGREDPQLFYYKDKVHMAFVGVRGGASHYWADQTHVLYTELRDDLTAKRVFYPKPPNTYPGRWEKNWQWFQYQEELYAIYSISPHRILKVNRDDAQWVHETPYPHHWDGGEQRGGATPVLVKDEWWCFFHDSIGDRKLYRMGLYTFENKPPFKIKRFIPYPILTADLSIYHDNYCDVLFPRGAVFDGIHWFISSGVHDRWGEIRVIQHQQLERQLISTKVMDVLTSSLSI